MHSKDRAYTPPYTKLADYTTKKRLRFSTPTIDKGLDESARLVAADLGMSKTQAHEWLYERGENRLTRIPAESREAKAKDRKRVV